MYFKSRTYSFYVIYVSRKLDTNVFRKVIYRISGYFSQFSIKLPKINDFTRNSTVDIYLQFDYQLG